MGTTGMVWGSILYREEEEMLTLQGHVAPTDQSISDGLQPHNLQNQTTYEKWGGVLKSKTDGYLMKRSGG